MDEERKARPRLESEPGHPSRFLGLLWGREETCDRPIKRDSRPRFMTQLRTWGTKKRTWGTLSGEGEHFEGDMRLLTIVVITSIIRAM
jgi:hypothetical protein